MKAAWLARWALAAGAVAAGGLASPAVGAAAAATDALPLSGAAYRHADAAYRAFDRGDDRTAADEAREALRQRPDQASLRDLLRRAEARLRDGSAGRPAAAPGHSRRTVPSAAAARGANVRSTSNAGSRRSGGASFDAAMAPSKSSQASPAAASALSTGAPATTRSPGYAAAAAAFAALDRDDVEAAIVAAAQAVREAPQDRRYRGLQLAALLRGGRDAEADLAAAAAIALSPEDPVPWVLRAKAQHALEQRTAASADLDHALRLVALGTAGAASAADQRDLRLIAADQALAAAMPQRALELLQGLAPFVAADPQVDARLRLARLAASGRVVASPAWAALRIDCGQADEAHPCRVAPAAFVDPAYAIAAAAYAAYARRDYAQAAEEARSASALAPADLAYRRLLADALAGVIDASLARGERGDARRRWQAAQADGSLAALGDLDAAFLASRVGEDDEALRRFDRAESAGALTRVSAADAAYAAQRLGQDDRAIRYFERSIEATPAPADAAAAQALFETRRAASEVSRQGGVFASLTYGGALSGVGLAPGARANSLQAGVEGYWRPLGYRDGRYVELFARGFETLAGDGGVSGAGSREGAVGVRDKPFKALNLVASLSRVFAASGGRDDWLVQLGYSADVGSDLRLDADAWWTSRAFAETGRYLSSGETYALAHADLGRSIRIGAADSRWVLFPHLSIAADRDSTASERSAAGIGPGLALRYWFRESPLRAPRSYVDVSVQYRARVSGAARGGGPFAAVTLSY